MANAVITVLEADGVTETDVTVLDVGRQAAAASKSTAMSTEDKAVLDAMAASLAIIDDVGRAAEASSLSVAVSTEDKAVLDAIAASLALIDNSIAAGNELQVDVVAALPAGTNNIGDVDILSVVPGVAATNLGKAEDAAHTTGDTGVMALAVRSDAGTAFGADGDYVPLSIDSSGAVRVTGGGGGTQYTEGDTDASITGSAVMWEDSGNTLASVRVGNPLPVQLRNSSGTEASILTTVAHDAVDAGDPMKVGMRTLAHGTNPTAVAAADRTDWLANRAGVPWVIGGHPNIVTKSATIDDADGAQTNASLLTVSAGSKIVVTMISATCSSTNTGSVAVRIGFGTATLSAASEAGTTKILLEGKFAAGGGHQRGSGAGIVGVGADDEDLRITCDDPAGGSLFVTFSYYTIES